MENILATFLADISIGPEQSYKNMAVFCSPRDKYFQNKRKLEFSPEIMLSCHRREGLASK